MVEDIDKKRQRLLFRAKLYRLAAAVFAFAGVIIFIVLYAHKGEGSVFEIFKEWLAVALILMPFVFSSVFTMLAKGVEGKLKKLSNR